MTRAAREILPRGRRSWIRALVSWGDGSAELGPGAEPPRGDGEGASAPRLLSRKSLRGATTRRVRPQEAHLQGCRKGLRGARGPRTGSVNIMLQRGTRDTLNSAGLAEGDQVHQRRNTTYTYACVYILPYMGEYISIYMHLCVYAWNLRALNEPTCLASVPQACVSLVTLILGVSKTFSAR
jgi:hypothetical protein